MTMGTTKTPVSSVDDTPEVTEQAQRDLLIECAADEEEQGDVVRDGLARFQTTW
jgi:hypothetical protein